MSSRLLYCWHTLKALCDAGHEHAPRARALACARGGRAFFEAALQCLGECFEDLDGVQATRTQAIFLICAVSGSLGAQGQRVMDVRALHFETSS